MAGSDPKKPNDESPFDKDKLPDREKLPTELQKIVDNADKDGSIYDDILDGT